MILKNNRFQPNSYLNKTPYENYNETKARIREQFLNRQYENFVDKASDDIAAAAEKKIEELLKIIELK